MKTILSTKKLSLSQMELLLNAGVSLVEYNAIKIETVSFEAPLKIENAIFTSQNGIKAFFENGVRSSAVENCFCVGEKTKILLENNGFQVIKMTEYASELADYLVKNHKSEAFHFFCGNIRSDEIPTKLNKNKIPLEEIEVYKTTLNPMKFKRNFDAVLFFSPSGVRSFFTENEDIEMAVCIGKTTASEAKNYTDKVVISNATTVESVIAKAVKTLR
ncbi:uroporphyrinogen-III synthase [Aequorivita sp. SDUM287046]|uniref:Uroporphyrinogen-III synthase n=1 Tax=Aequorivita aurantiaca TaxID=3053356 RepID=A0ABT8DEI8_9FLAO|nr:uroporphyrinogen-III synthase [Aequorivita aurantiaca]MDN3723208.1 uroporphyrinogen-III synthase [Aequorivita aurantiaca]